MITKNKKGLGIEWYFLIIAFFLGLGFYFVNYLGEHKTIKNYIGQYQFSILQSNNNAENTIFYIDQSAKYSLGQAIHELAQSGGIIKLEDDEETFDEEASLGSKDSPDNKDNEADTEEGCGNYYGYSIWYDFKKDDSGDYVKNSCIDDGELRYNLEYLFNKNLNQYLINNPYNIPTDNYDYRFKDRLEVIGSAKQKLKFSIVKDETQPVIEKATELNLPTEPPKKEEPKPVEPPNEPKKEEKPVETKGFSSFTGTSLCAKGKGCLLTKEAYGLLLEAEKIAETKGVFLAVTSAYRSKDEQRIIWNRYAKVYPDPKIRRKRVANPDECKGPCPHETGNVVDITFQKKTFGTMSSKEWQLLEQIMSQAGWVRYAAEEWHFECCGTPRYARAKEKGVIAIV